jgi:aspartyl-tRNA(Asn)/glutamyl-tRNA(Gln) amidotransferase subunit C
VPVTRDEVEAMARLARLRLDADEADRLAAQLSDILSHMDALRSAALDGVPPFSIAASDVAPPRGDVPGADPLLLPPATLAPVWRDGFFTVPRLAAQRGSAAAAADAADADTSATP